MAEPLERVARALCRCDGHMEDIRFEKKPMWASYMGEANAVLNALKIDPLVSALENILHDAGAPSGLREASEQALKLYRTGKGR